MRYLWWTGLIILGWLLLGCETAEERLAREQQSQRLRGRASVDRQQTQDAGFPTHIECRRTALSISAMRSDCPDGIYESVLRGDSWHTKKIASVYQERQPVSVGYMRYQVHRSAWQDTLSRNRYLDTFPDAAYLFILLGVINVDRQERTLPPLKLVDEAGREYGQSDKAWRVEHAMGVMQNLNPGVQKDGYLVFDVPKERAYKLKVSGGYWSTETALIALKPPSPDEPLTGKPAPTAKSKSKKVSVTKSPSP